jgi:hypothetical protein
MPIVNYDEMHAIFSFGLATGKFMGSSEPMCTPPSAPSVEDVFTQESDTVILDGPPKKVVDESKKLNVGKRKRGTFAQDELAAFTNMIVSMKDVAKAIRDNKPIDIHPQLY